MWKENSMDTKASACIGNPRPLGQPVVQPGKGGWDLVWGRGVRTLDRLDSTINRKRIDDSIKLSF